MNIQHSAPTNSNTIEGFIRQRLGVSIDDLVATLVDFADEQVKIANESGVDVDSRARGLASLLAAATEPKALVAANSILRNLPVAAELLEKATHLSDLLAVAGDMFDDFQSRYADQGIDLEQSITNGFHAAMWLGCNIDEEDLARLGELLKSDILSPQAVDVIGNTASALTAAQSECDSKSTKDRVGLLGLIRMMRNPDVQRSVAFFSKFAESFGKNV